MSARNVRRRASVCVGLALALGALDASAYCRTRTCNPDPARMITCDTDGMGCILDGDELYWESSCVSFAIQESGSSSNGVSASEFESIVEQGFDAWLAADCSGAGSPSIEISALGTVECDAAEYNQSDGNANIFLFRDDEWPYPGAENALGLSTINYDPRNGHIFDVDVEINGTDTPISIEDAVPPEAADLLSIVTHEIGHFLGLSHSRTAGATMVAQYRPGQDDLRTLEADDIAGICDVYPPDREAVSDSCSPRHGFSSDCGQPPDEGCSLRAPARGHAGLALFAAALVAARLRRSRRAPAA